MLASLLAVRVPADYRQHHSVSVFIADMFVNNNKSGKKGLNLLSVYIENVLDFAGQFEYQH